MRKLVDYNREQQEQAAQRWRLILELSRTETPTAIGARLGLSPSRISQIIGQARAYFGEAPGEP